MAERWFIEEQKEIQKVLIKSKTNSNILKQSKLLKEQYGLSIEINKICSILKFIDYSKQTNKYRNEDELIKIINDKKYFEIVDILTAKLKDLKEEEKYSKDFETIEDKLYSTIFNKDYISGYSEFIKWKKTFKDEKRIAANILENFSYFIFIFEEETNIHLNSISINSINDMANDFINRKDLYDMTSTEIKNIHSNFIRNNNNIERLKSFKIEVENLYEGFDEYTRKELLEEKTEVIKFINNSHNSISLLFNLIMNYEDSNINNNNLDGVVSSIKKWKKLNFNF
jgi:hypothetical protein